MRQAVPERGGTAVRLAFLKSVQYGLLPALRAGGIVTGPPYRDLLPVRRHVPVRVTAEVLEGPIDPIDHIPCRGVHLHATQHEVGIFPLGTDPPH